MSLWKQFLLIAIPTALVLGAAPRRIDRSAGPYAAWAKGPGRDPGYFPIAVWLQNPANAGRYKAAGINLYVALWEGPTGEQLAQLRSAGMRVICQQNRVGLEHKDDPTIVGWMHEDEPDNAQPIRDPATGKQGYGPCIPPPRIVKDYEKLHAADPTRPILLNLGQGVANDEWIGRGSGASLKDYETYVKGADIVSFDVYPVAGLDRGEEKLWYVPKGVDRLISWTNKKKPIWNCVECTRIGGDKKASPEQVRSEVWMALIHGSRGLIYFVHQFKPTETDHALLDDPEMLKMVTSVNRQIKDLAPVLNSDSVQDRATVTSSVADLPIDVMVKKHDRALYLFSVAMRNRSARGSFHISGLPTRTRAEVLGEGRTIEIRNGAFGDEFGPYGVHLYRIAP